TKGNLIGVTGTSGISRAYAYADPLDAHNLTSVTEATGRVAVVNTYDSSDRVITQTEGLRRIDFDYQVPLTRTRVTRTIKDASGVNPYTSVTTYEFGPGGRITRITDPYGNENRYIYNAAMQLARREVWQNSSGTLSLLLARDWTYDLAGHKQSEFVTLDSGEVITRSWTYTGDWVASEQVVSSFAPARIFRTEYTFNLGNSGEPVSIQTQKRRLEDGSFQVTQFEYDSQNRLARTTLADGVVMVNEYTGNYVTRQGYEVGGVAIPQGEKRFGFDSSGNPENEWDSLQHLTQYTHDDRGRVLTITDPLNQQIIYTYSGDLLVQIERGHTAADGEGMISKFIHDNYGRVTAVQRKNDAGAFITFESYSYDSEGQRLSATDAAGRITRYTYDLEGHLASTVDPANQVTQFFYDGAGRRIRIVAPLGRETLFEYDDLGRRTATVQNGVSPNARTAFSYDAVGNVTQILDGENHATTFAYDTLSRLRVATRPMAQQVQYFYDDRNRVDYFLNARGQKIDLNYEPWGPLSEQRIFASAGASTPLRTISLSRDANGNLLSISDDGVQAGAMLSYTYDALNRTLDETISYIPGGNRVLQRRYDRFGNQKELSLVDGTTVSDLYTFNKLGQLAGASLGGSSLSHTYLPDGRLDIETMSGVLTRDHGYDARGFLSSIVSSGGSGGTDQLAYTMDDAGRLDTYADGFGSHDVSYDGVDRVIAALHPAASGLPTAEAFAYDRAGNREDPSNPTLFQYDANNRITASPGVTYTPDADGNIAAASSGITLTHDALNRLATFSSGATVANYTYDSANRRIRKTIGGQSTWFLWDGQRLLAQYDNAGVRTARYAYLPGASAPLMFSDTNGSYWARQDRRGAVRQLTTTSGTIVWRAEYSAYGNAIVNADPDGNGQAIAFPLRLPGQYADAESGLYYNLARYYDPVLGRYLEEDPLPSINQYWYGNGDPFSIIDPLGMRGGKIYKWPPNNYGDYPPPGSPCEVAVFRHGILMGWEPCDQCDGSGGSGGGGPPPFVPKCYDGGYDCIDGAPHPPSPGPDDGDDDDNGDDDGDHDGGSDDNDRRRDHCFGSGEFLGNSDYYKGLALGYGKDKGIEKGYEAVEDGLWGINRRIGGVIVRDVLPPYLVYEALYGIPKEVCESMYPDD
ncbi:MAG TPA: RHS repeat-associated core domain-containing protein, partial [Povalibacter sp.]|nr:RHS repeat-associated core domain-containing protein [Povalibacter sp.]